ncbi:glycosyltransferase family 2 protein [Chryseobacterium polytrichastri]|uniref:Glycosyl transferase family 2 n=1 Tax=Chryseobacterium polytrichastri TaxID=1302687 RepID=A0A1M6X8B0_9FLAO|nr:glycosyltransferase family 2 protein [Chryseobacterium polytrichastri]SHL02242.1 Glycosyl transferase family 2 [Chryseobacterium polytrichastri]
MEKKDLVSIVVCSYNQGKYIKECLDSVKAQTYPNIQLIVADDASPDNSVQVFENWLSENNYPATTHFHQKNTGLATVLNECIELIEGKYVKVIAADDFLHPEAIEKCVAELEKSGKDYGMVFTDTYGIDENSNSIPDIADYNSLGNINKDDFRKLLIKGNRVAALTVLMTKEALIKTGEYKSDYLVEDYYRWLKINALYYIAYIPEKLAYYRIHGENISISKKQRIDTETLILQMMFDKNGDAKDKINDKTQKSYFTGEKISSEYSKAYQKYPYHIKRLKIAIQYKLPVSLYKFLSKII